MTTPARQIEMLFVENIEVHERARLVNGGAVDVLASSMDRLGLRTPISVRYYPERPENIPGDTHDALVLMTGAHRLEAAKRLGWEKIECFVYGEGDEIDAELWEIAENLHRSDLTKEQRDEHIRRYAELLAAREGKPGQNVHVSEVGGRGNKAVATKIAEETGISAKTVKRALNPERARVEREKNADRQALRAEAVDKLAGLLAECVPGHFWDALKANLYAAGCKKVAQEFERLIGVSVFDGSRTGERVEAERPIPAVVAQRAEQPICDRPVAGSTPAGGTALPPRPQGAGLPGATASGDEPQPEAVESSAQNPQSPSTNDEASPEAGPQAEASPSREQVTGTLAGREGRSEGEAVSAGLPTSSRPLNPRCQKAAQGDPCKFSHTSYSCWQCNQKYELARAGSAA